LSREESVLRPILAVVFLAFSLLSLLSLVSFDAEDLPFYSAQPNRPVHNWVGEVGARWAGFLLFWFGASSYAIAGVCATFSLVWLVRGRITDPWTRLVGATLFVLALATLLAMVKSPLGYGYGPSRGGAIGLGGAVIVSRLFAVPGGIILLAAVAALSAILATDLFFYKVSVGAAGRVRKLAKKRAGASRSRGRSPRAGVTRAEAGVSKAAPESAGVEEEKVTTEPEVATVEAAWERAEVSRASRSASAAVSLWTQPGQDEDGYEFPSIDLLDPAEESDGGGTEEAAEQNARTLATTLAHFGITARVVRVERGPVVTLFELELAPGIKVNRVTSLADDLAIALRAPAVRVVAPIPGKSTIGVEVPNTYKDIVRLREVLERAGDKIDRYSLPLLLGKTISGDPLVADLGEMPHLLIAGTTGSGKSVCLNSIIVTLLMTRSPRDVKLLLVDPKMVELAVFQGIPHLLMPIVTDLRQAARALDWATKEMDRRYDLLALVRVRDIKQYNKLGPEGIREKLSADIEDGAELDDVPMHLPYIIIIVDELADLMMSAPKEVEYSITRLSQKSRAVGVHIIVATQRPSVDVITGLIKANMPGRIAFQVSAKTDSRIILDQNGAERLLGRGDMLFMGAGTSKLVRAQGTYTSDGEMRRVVRAGKSEESPEYELALPKVASAQAGGVHMMPPAAESSSRDPLYEDAARIVLQSRRGSVSLLQRKLEIGYTRAARLVDMMAEDGIVGGYKGSKAREVIISLEEWEERRNAKQQSAV